MPGLILGTAQLVTDYGVTRSDSPPRSTVEATGFLHEAAAMGVRTLDTAPAYGHAEEVIGEVAGDFVIHTKVAKGIRSSESLRKSLQRLCTDIVDILYVHDIADFRTRPKEFDDELAECLQNGARRVGVSLYSPDEIDMVLQCTSIGVIQVPLNVLDRRFIPHLTRLRDAGVSVIVRSVFLQGALICSHDALPARVRHLAPSVREFQSRCTTANVNPLTACLAHITRLPTVEGVVVGAQSTEELRDIVGAWTACSEAELDIDFLEDFPLPDPASVDPRLWTNG